MSLWNHDADPSDYLPINDRVQLFKVCVAVTEYSCNAIGLLACCHGGHRAIKSGAVKTSWHLFYFSLKC